MTRKISIVLALALLTSPVQAQVPNINGTWHCYAQCLCAPKRLDHTEISQTGSDKRVLSLTNECGIVAHAYIQDDMMSFSSDWGTGSVKDGASKIDFSNGSEWVR
jgi:hypothetical protein